MSSFDPSRLRELREHVGKSREQVALDAGVTAFSIYSYERGVVTPSVKVLVRLAESLGCKPGDLFTAAARG